MAGRRRASRRQHHRDGKLDRPGGAEALWPITFPLQPFINHMKKLRTKNKDEEAARNYCRHLPVRINGKPIPALIDSGNLWKPAISKEFYESLGLKIADLTKLTEKVATAKKDDFLDVLGEVQTNLWLTTLNSPKRWPIKPIVVGGLSMAVNISGPWMKAMRWDQIHSEDGMMIDQELVPLCRPEAIREKAMATAFTTEETIIPARTIANIGLNIPEVKQGKDRKSVG